MIVFGSEKVVCKEVTLDEGIYQLSLLLNDFDENEAIGLAANQIGLTGRVFILNISGTTTGFINPVLHSSSGTTIGTEGCLSFPGKFVEVKRASEIVVSDLLNPEPMKLSGINAIAWQHEYDHLDGISMFDRRGL